MNTLKKISYFTLALIFSFLFPIKEVMAADLPSANSNLMIPIEKTGITRENAIKILGVNEEEAKQMSFYVVDAEPAKSGIGISPGETHVFPTFTFTGTNIGSYWTCKGTKLTWAAIHHSAADENTYIAIFLYGYGRENPNNIFEGCTGHVLSLRAGDSYNSGVFVSSPKDYDYHFVYYGGNQSKVTMIVGVL